jgi:peptidoglycan-N-acetylglucosamine deacetylase
MLPRLLAWYMSKGFSFVTLEEAEKDPFYTGSMNPAMDAPPNLLEVAMQAKGLPLPARAKVGVEVNSLCR